MNIAAVKVIITLHHSVRLKRQGEAMRNLQKKNLKKYFCQRNQIKEREKNQSMKFFGYPLCVK